MVFKRHQLVTNKWSVLILTILITVIASEFKVIPFNGEDFRFGLGSAAFFFLLLIFQPTSYILTGFLTGVVVVIVRIVEDMIITGDAFWLILGNHLPAFLFYLLFGAGLSVIRLERFKKTPLHLGAIAAALEFTANSVEHIVRYLLLGNLHFEFQEWMLLALVAIFRSYFVVGLYSSIVMMEQNKRVQEMLEVGSNLYAETLYLQKSMNHIEQITASSHDLYRKLKSQEHLALSTQALKIAQEIHEVKKDSQRILAGLQKITKVKREKYYFLSEVVKLVTQANEKYSELLKKEIVIQCTFSIDFETEQQIPLLALLNNICANAVEAISSTGEINIDVYEESDKTWFIIKDTGKGISMDDQEIVFEPGYTTKFNESGVAATGIGLSHAKEIITTLGGKVQIESSEKGAVFKINIPTKNIRR
ncbi:two-component system, sensor histidine kinase YcbA [Psychrobacillus sp. OK028]|uniref:sensor histidine kinase n=1 Tax=Psychrobacillus sp. OK028 TaxID=1884359 RepID=UPI000885CE7A|nr:sensor histidine kinase [Psychrobacillus sp. OK028]SDN87466.1 two-component system, sensor histidine kinase YcbA [Psychrobacillus sp. OK028]